MAEWSVAWYIDVDADTPQEAAEKAREYQTRPGTTATVFHVLPYVGHSGAQTRQALAEGIEVDLTEHTIDGDPYDPPGVQSGWTP